MHVAWSFELVISGFDDGLGNGIYRYDVQASPRGSGYDTLLARWI